QCALLDLPPDGEQFYYEFHDDSLRHSRLPNSWQFSIPGLSRYSDQAKLNALRHEAKRSFSSLSSIKYSRRFRQTHGNPNVVSGPDSAPQADLEGSCFELAVLPFPHNDA